MPGLILQPGADPRGGLRPQLANPRLGHIHDCPDFLQIQPLLVAQRQQQLFAVGQGIDGVDQGLAEIPGQQRVQWVPAGRAVDQGRGPVGLAGG
ncbi:hypothetical protein D3C72_1768100 [compost metagenome]